MKQVSLILVTLLCSVAITSHAAQPRYKMVAGKGYGVCEAYLKHLNAFPPTEPPMICEHKINPKFKDISEPKWEELDIASNMKLVYEADIQRQLLWVNNPATTRFNNPKPDYETWRNAFEEKLKKEHLKPRLRRTTVTIHRYPNVNIPGNPIVTIIAYEPDLNLCQQEKANSVGYAPDGGGAHMFVLGVDPASPLIPFNGIAAANRFQILVHRGQAFFTRTLSESAIYIEPLDQNIQEPLYVMPDRCKIVLKK
jgi:hypothetical protein